MLKLKGLLQMKEGEIVGIASTESEDRDGESIKQDGWDLKSYETNPVLLASHNYHDFPIGKATEIAVVDNKLVFKAVFSQATKQAKEAYALVKEGILNTFSVGFIPREYQKDNSNVITKAELLEISLVSVPANPQAIVTAKSMKGNMTQELVKIWLTNEETATKVKKLEGKVKKVKSSAKVRKNKTNGEDGAKVDTKTNEEKTVQVAVGLLQEYLCEKKKKGGAKK